MCVGVFVCVCVCVCACVCVCVCGCVRAHTCVRARACVLECVCVGWVFGWVWVLRRFLRSEECHSFNKKSPIESWSCQKAREMLASLTYCGAWKLTHLLDEGNSHIRHRTHLLAQGSHTSEA